MRYDVSRSDARLRSAVSLATLALIFALGTPGACTSVEDKGDGGGLIDIGPIDGNGGTKDARDTLDAKDADGRVPDAVETVADIKRDSEACEPPAATGCPCSGNDDCASSVCIEGKDGSECAKLCFDSCPPGYDCLQTTIGGDPVSICMPRHVRLCRPCNTDADCDHPQDPGTALCLEAMDPADGSFCGTSCEGGVPCPADYTCAVIDLDGGGEAKQCVPSSGECECRESWADMNLSTACLVENDWGACEGTRSCGPFGLTTCEGPIPAAETCNSKDDDCNGTVDDIAGKACSHANEFGTCPGWTACDEAGEETCEGPAAGPESCDGTDEDCDGFTDEGTCSDGLECTNDACSPDQVCLNELKPGYCLIDGACKAEGDVNPADTCERCQPAKSTNSWSDATGVGCDDGNACTWEDTCAAGVCKGTPYVCNDGIECTNDICDGEGGCLQQLVAGSCLIGGACVPDGQPQTPGSCMVCDAAQSPKAWLPNDGGACDDGDDCTQDDTCAGATCGGTAYDCDDGDPCTVDSCKGDGTCNHEQATDACVIDGVCYAAGTVNETQSCLACRPGMAIDAWSPVDPGTLCDDTLECTRNDKCVAGACQGTPYVCNDGLPCTADICDGAGGCLEEVNPGSCFIGGVCVADGQLQTEGGCMICDADLSPQAWVPNDGGDCDDGDDCTDQDMCQGATCAGTLYECDDGNACTVDICNGDGTCGFVQVNATCIIEGECVASGDTKTDNPCLACRPDVSKSAWSPVDAGTACDDDQPCTSKDKCTAGSCQGTPYICNDGYGCTADICDGAGGCLQEVLPSSCFIGSTCYPDGTPQAVGSCMVCDAELSPIAWVPNDGAACDDGLACTADDICDGATCGGTTYSCDDSDSCTQDICNGDGTCSHPQEQNTCVIDGACYAAGTINETQPCLACRPGTSTTAWSPVDAGTVCDDGQPCTSADKCVAGACQGTPYICNDGFTCTNDICDGTGGCLQEVKAGSCFIADACYADGALQTAGGCNICDADASPKAWVPNDGGACDDGQACTKDDLCSGATCSGTTYSCDDGDSCTVDACNGDGTCSHTQAENTCVIDGVCYAAGTVKADDTCLECRPTVNATAWSAVDPGKSCDDGVACTHGDQCVAGTCQGTSYSCNDGLACTSDSCDGDGSCTFAPLAGKCVIDDACYNSGTVPAGQPCLYCNPTSSATSWTLRSPGYSCDDGELCTYNDQCNAGGSCVGTSKACSDGLWCTTDACDGNGGCIYTASTGCLIGGSCYSDGALRPGNTCQECDLGAAKTSWSAIVGKVCYDGDNCTYGDLCDGTGTCNGTSYSCNDGLWCTTDACVDDRGSSCSNTRDSSTCLISGTCYNDGDTQPGNSCYDCNSSTPTSWSYNNGASCNDGNDCTSSDSCSSGTCTGSPILDSYEPNGSTTAAPSLGSVKDSDNYPKGSIGASLYGTNDVDWYKYSVSDTVSLSNTEPRVDLKNIPAGMNYKVCIYYDCTKDGETTVSCKNGSSSSYNGMPGCCSDNPGTAAETAKLAPNCKCGLTCFDDSGTAYVQVTRTSGTWTCNSYTLEWGDD